MIKVIFFDFDGTLAHTHKLGRRIIQEIIAEEGLTYNPRLTTLPHLNLRDKLAMVYPNEHERLFTLFDARFTVLFPQAVTAYPGVIQTITQLHKQRILLVIYSTKYSKHITNALLKFQLKDCFSEIYGREHEPSKPNPALILDFLTKNHLSKHEALLVGDNALDEQAARKAGIRFVFMQHADNEESVLKPFATLSSMQELIEIVAREQ